MSNALQELSNAMAAAVEGLTPSLLRVDGRQRLPATGIAWSEDGLIVTANHVLERDENINITLHDGSSHEATLVGRDPQNDLAVLKINTTLRPATWGENETLKVGHLALALGKPGEQVQATLGVVSALVGGAENWEWRERRKGKRRRRRGRRFMRALVDGYIQTDVVMYPGFSGGPLVSGDSAVHGMNTSGFGRGASVAVPVATIRNTVNTLQAHGKMKQGYLGVGVQPARLPENVASELEQDSGLLIISVESESPAQQGGLFVGDIIVALNEEPVEQMDELLAALNGEQVGQEVPLQLVRGGAIQTVSVTIGERN